MQLNKVSKKTSKIAEKAAAAAPENSPVAEVAAKPRVSRSSKAKKSEGQEMTSGKHLHKPASPVLAEPVVSEETQSTPKFEAKKKAPAAAIERQAVETQLVDTHAVAKLAYSYWVERGHAHGSAEEDWLRAEKALAAGK